MYKDLNEQNAGLTAENSLLKKQLSYFEDVFAKSSLVGYDSMNNNINRSDLEEFQRNLLKKINSRLYDERELSNNAPEDSFDFMNGRTNNIDLDQLSSTSASNDNNLNSLRLVRSRANSGNFSNVGYLFLAIVFCMMCCSSFLNNPTKILNMASELESLSPFSQFQGRKLMFNQNQ